MISHRFLKRLAVTLSGVTGAICIAPGVAGPAGAQAPTDQPGAQNHPVLVELFLSQACNSCPPAAALFPEIAARKDVVALAWHVDYWNMTDSAQGRWTDPYSHKAFTDRQKRYNFNIRHRSSIYTPQIVVSGQAETLGGNREKISALINSIDRPAVGIEVSEDDGGVNFSVGENEHGGNAYLVTFKRSATTRITSGENAGKVFDEVNVVTNMRPLGIVLRKGSELAVPAPAAGDGCALIVQAPQQKHVIAAAYC